MKHHPITLLLTALQMAACSRAPSETYGFIATLGTDTTSVERVTRTGNRIVSDAVSRSPNVIRRHWEATLASDGTIERWNMSTSIPNAPAAANTLHHSLVFTDGTVQISRHGAGDSTDVAYQKKYAVTVPWNAYVYGSYELLFDMAMTRPDSTHIGQYFFEGWDEGHIGYAEVRKLGNGDYSITSTGLAGAGVGHLDEKGRMLSYSGQGTTYKQEVKRVADAPDVEAIATRFAAEEKAKGVVRSLSVRDTSRASIAGTTFAIDYSRPLARGRTLVGGLIPYDRVWRTGANAATQLIVSAPVSIGGAALNAGTYTLWTIPSSGDVKLIINRQTGQWGTGYRSEYDIARVAMRVDTTQSNVEQFTIRVEPDTAAANSANGRLVLEWGTFRWSVPVIVKK
jgi:hypothetical protein